MCSDAMTHVSTINGSKMTTLSSAHLCRKKIYTCFVVNGTCFMVKNVNKHRFALLTQSISTCTLTLYILAVDDFVSGYEGYNPADNRELPLTRKQRRDA